MALKKIRAKATLFALLAAGVTVGFIFLAAALSLFVIRKLHEQAAVHELHQTCDAGVSIFSTRLSLALGDLALLENLTREKGSAAREALLRGMRSLQSFREIYAGGGLFDSQGREIFSIGAVPRAMGEGAAGDSSWLVRARELAPREVLIFSERLAAAPVFILVLKLESAEAENFAALVIPAHKILEDAALGANDPILLLVTQSGEEFPMGASQRFRYQGKISLSILAEKGSEGQLKTSDFIASWSALRLPDLQKPLPEDIRISAASKLDWKLVALRSMTSIEEEISEIAVGVGILNFALALISAPLAFVGALAFFRVLDLRLRLKQVLDASPGGILEVRIPENSKDLKLELVNPAAIQILASTENDGGNRLILPAKLESLIRQIISSERATTAEIQLFESPLRWVSVRAAPNKSSVVVALMDITERRNQEESLRLTEQSLELAARMAKIGAWRVDFVRQEIWWSAEVRRIHAVPEDYQPDLASVFDFYPPDSRERLRAMCERCIESGEEFEGEFDFRDFHGRLLWVHVIGQAERDPATGQVIFVHGTLQDITEIHESSVALTESRELLSVAFWGASLSVSDCRFDTGEFVFDANLLRLLGYEKRQVIPTLRFRDSLMPEEDRRLWAESLEAAASGKSPLFECEYRLMAKDGSYRWILERSKIVAMDDANRPARMVGILTDITRLKQAEEFVARALEHEKTLARKAQSASEARKGFLAMMSHEIRTPLNSVLGFAEMLAGRPLDSEAAEYVATIRESGTALLRILNDILDYSRIESGKLEIESHAYNPQNVVRAVVGMFQPTARSKGLNFNFAISEGMPEALLGDEVRVKQILVNLVGNAVKFTSAGSVKIQLGLDDDRKNVVFTVADTGPGIEEPKLEAIFEPFMQADLSISRSHGGTGLGLAISSRLVHLMNGTMWAESKVGKGSKFSFSLPLQPASSDLLREPSPEIPQKSTYASLHPLKILIAEDDRVNARLTKLILTRLGYSPVVVCDGSQAVHAAAAERPDLIFMDLRMPNMDGLEATRTIRAFEAQKTTKQRIFIAALTADVLPEGREESFKAGMDDYVTKPVSSEKIMEVLRKAEIKNNAAATA